MGNLVESIRRAIVQERYVIGSHASRQLEIRDLPIWAIVNGTLEANWARVRTRHRSRPNPSIRLAILLPTGEQATVIWSWVLPDALAKLVTVFFEH
jgi:hypothetical protein